MLMENFLPGALERMGLGDDVLHSRNPRLVHGVISGYGHNSSRATWPALDFEDYIVRLHSLAQAGKIGNPRRPATLIHFSMLWQEQP